jgi:hypothetical protein
MIDMKVIDLDTEIQKYSQMIWDETHSGKRIMTGRQTSIYNRLTHRENFMRNGIISNK